MFGSGDNMANMIGRGTTRVAMIGVFFMFLIAPLLVNPIQKCHEHLGGKAGFKMLQARVRIVSNETSDHMSSLQCENVRNDQTVQTMVSRLKKKEKKRIFVFKFYD